MHLLFLLASNFTFIWDASPSIEEVSHYNIYVKTNTVWKLHVSVTNHTHVTITNITIPFVAGITAVNKSGESEITVVKPKKVTIKHIILEDE